MVSDTGPTALPFASAPAYEEQQVDYATVRLLRRRVADRLSAEVVSLRQRRGSELTPADRQMLGRALIDEELGDWVGGLARAGDAVPSATAEQALAEAVFAALFGLGRLQRWVTDPQVENIDVDGCDQVFISTADGSTVPAPPVADSDTELIEMIQSFAAYLGQSAREFSSARPLLNLRLPDGARLAAWMAITPRPGLSIRRHRHTDVTLDDLLALGTLDLGLVAFLRAAVRARKNIIVTGGVNAGKTTLVRALANDFHPDEKLVVCEKDYELGLDRLRDRHRQVVCMESREPNAEGSGEVSLATLVTHALRMNPRRIIVGEVRGDELIPMLTAMGSGNDGSLCTLHANGPHAAFNRMAAIGLSSPERLPVEAAHLLAADAVDFVVHVELREDPNGTRRRFVSGILEVLGIGEGGRVARNETFRRGPDGRAVPGAAIDCLDDLIRVGYDPAFHQRRDGWWDSASIGATRSGRRLGDPVTVGAPR